VIGDREREDWIPDKAARAAEAEFCGRYQERADFWITLKKKVRRVRGGGNSLWSCARDGGGGGGGIQKRVFIGTQEECYTRHLYTVVALSQVRLSRILRF